MYLTCFPVFPIKEYSFGPELLNAMFLRREFNQLLLNHLKRHFSVETSQKHSLCVCVCVRMCVHLLQVAAQSDVSLWLRSCSCVCVCF